MVPRKPRLVFPSPCSDHANALPGPRAARPPPGAERIPPRGRRAPLTAREPGRSGRRAPSPVQPSTSQAAAARRMRVEAGARAEAGGDVAGSRGPAGRRAGSSCRRPSARRSAPLPRHSAWNARGWKLSTSWVAASRVGQQKVPRRGEAMGCARGRVPRLSRDPAGRPGSCAGLTGRGTSCGLRLSPPPPPPFQRPTLAEKAPGLAGAVHPPQTPRGLTRVTVRQAGPGEG